ncbi:NAD-dependent protein deacetylase sirtuin-2 [Entomophthora muscae]|uniref:NAD-dependent protein deacetylase sirtuin-2 n=1 Tax=Entomophthora muscae TaxID=34485 RepID=A0ACC2UCH5_9FUNG|nr:NAD-dependent protein deacetylase sirtuin-2 [Entomophthora muscae]
MSKKDQSDEAQASIKIQEILSESSKNQSEIEKNDQPKAIKKQRLVVKPTPELLPQHLDELKSLAELIKGGKVSKIIIMTGAGISTASGIPDFRTPGTGLYDNLQKYDLPYAEAIFDIDYFPEHPEAFFELASELYPGANYRPTWSHYFISLLAQKGLLLRNFSQNIDGLEHEAGIPSELLVEAHGHFRTSTCLSCRASIDTNQVKQRILDKKIPKCNVCHNGILKPDITFFGENLPSRFYTLMEKDFPTCDLLLVMGTSLKVAPFSTLVDLVKKDVPTFLINLVDSFKAVTQTRSKKYNRHLVLAPCDEACWELAGLLGWQDELVDLYINALPEDIGAVTSLKTEVADSDLADELDKLKI